MPRPSPRRGWLRHGVRADWGDTHLGGAGAVVSGARSSGLSRSLSAFSCPRSHAAPGAMSATNTRDHASRNPSRPLRPQPNRNDHPGNVAINPIPVPRSGALSPDVPGMHLRPPNLKRRFSGLMLLAHRRSRSGGRRSPTCGSTKSCSRVYRTVDDAGGSSARGKPSHREDKCGPSGLPERRTPRLSLAPFSRCAA